MMRFPTCYQNKTEAIAYFHKTYLSILYVPVGPDDSTVRLWNVSPLISNDNNLMATMAEALIGVKLGEYGAIETLGSSSGSTVTPVANRREAPSSRSIVSLNSCFYLPQIFH